MKGLISSHARQSGKKGKKIMSDSGKRTFRLNLEDVKEIMGHLERNNGPNRFSKATVQRCIDGAAELTLSSNSSGAPHETC